MWVAPRSVSDPIPQVLPRGSMQEKGTFVLIFGRLLLVMMLLRVDGPAKTDLSGLGGVLAWELRSSRESVKFEIDM